MKPVATFCFCLLFQFCPLTHAQPSLQWLNRTGTVNDRWFDSRVILNANYLYHPLTDYHHYRYAEWMDEYSTSRPLDEFERHRLQQSQAGYQTFMSKHWRTGFVVEFPMGAEGQKESPEIFSIGKYDFTSETFPLLVRKNDLDLPVNAGVPLEAQNIDFDNLFKNAREIKEPTFTQISGALVRLIPKELPFSQIALRVPKTFAEEFKTRVINGGIHIYCLVDFDEHPTESFSSPTFTKEFEEEKDSWGYSRQPERAKKEYASVRGKPIETYHLLNVKFVVRGLRILGDDQLILFEWVAKNITMGQWVDSVRTSTAQQLEVKEKKIDESLVSDGDSPWKKEAIVASFRFESVPVTNQQFRSFLDKCSYIPFGAWGTPVTILSAPNGMVTKSVLEADKIPSDAYATRLSWNDCDIYLKSHGERLPCLIEWQEAYLHFYGNQIFNLKIFGETLQELCSDPSDRGDKHIGVGARWANGKAEWYSEQLESNANSITVGFRGFVSDAENK